VRLIQAWPVLFALATAPAFALDKASEAPPPNLDCKQGPLHRTYGGTQWLVYACNDARSAVVVSDTGNPAMPFYFMFYVDPSGDMKLHGEGEGKKTATQAAFDDLKKLTQADVAALVEEATRVVAPSKPAG